MPANRVPIALYLLSLPLIVAAFDLGVAAAVLLLFLAALAHWLSTLAALAKPADGPDYELETIPASHFVEKVRWCMDRLGVEYVEQPWAGTIGAFYRGRSVPQLRFRTGIVQSSIGNSAEILRYLWGASPTGTAAAAFLQPTPARLALEQQFDRYGVHLQVWVYHHLLAHRELTLHVWGADDTAIPAWQRFLIRLVYPLQAVLIRRAFRISASRYEKVTQSIQELLAEIETRLADGRRSLDGGDAPDYTDFAFASMTGLWLAPAGYGGGRAEAVRLHRDDMPAPMRADIDRWIEDYPRVIEFVERLYLEHRQSRAGAAADNSQGASL